MKAGRPHSRTAIERGREEVLARVLLHVIESARPVDLARYGRAGFNGCFEDVPDPFVGIHDVDDANAAKRPRIVGLAARGWIERGLIEHDFKSCAGLFARQHARREFTNEWIGVVETRHGIGFCGFCGFCGFWKFAAMGVFCSPARSETGTEK